MQFISGKGRTFERAANVRDLGVLGDPERWGGVGRVELQTPDLTSFDRTIYTPQIVRAQCSDLISRTWELIAFWTLTGVDPNDVYSWTLEVTLGSGQNSGKGEVVLAPPLPFAGLLDPWLTTATQGTVHLAQPVPACAIAIRGKLSVQTVGTPAHLVVASCSALVAPRAL